MPKHGKKDGIEKPHRASQKRSAVESMLFDDRHAGSEESEGEDRSWGEPGERSKPPHPRIASGHSSD